MLKTKLSDIGYFLVYKHSYHLSSNKNITQGDVGMKAIWTGAISFGLVNIPVRLYSAVQEHAIKFTLLCKKCNSPIAYERWCRNCNKEVAWHDIVKGLKLADGSYFVLTQEKIHELKPIKSETIDIKEFVESSEIKVIYLEHHYYLAPSKEGEKGFFLFKQALQEMNRVAIGTFVMRDKEYVCALTPYDKTILLTTLNYGFEIRSIDEIAELQKPMPKLDKEELQLAEQLIDQLTHKKFDLNKYKDTFAIELSKAIKKGKKSKVSLEAEKPSKPRKKKEGNLIASLKASLIAPGRSEHPVARAKSARARK